MAHGQKAKKQAVATADKLAKGLPETETKKKKMPETRASHLLKVYSELPAYIIN